MAIQYVGGQTQLIAGGATATTITFSLTGGLASTPAAGDLVVISYGIAAVTDLVFGVQTAGYTEVAELYSNDTFDANLSISYKFLTTAETTVVVDGITSASDNGSVVIQVFRFVDSVSPLDVTTTTATGSNGGLPNPPSITTSTNNAWVVACGAVGAGVTVTLGQTGLTAFTQAANAAGTNRSATAMGYVIQATAGAVDPTAWTNAGSANTQSWAAASLALRPAPALRSLFEDFETAVSPLTTYSGSRVQNIGQVGSYAYQTTVSYTNTPAMAVVPVDSTYLRYRFRFRAAFSANPSSTSADITLFRAKLGSGTGFAAQKINLTSAGVLTFKTVNENTATTVGSTPTIVNNRWYSVECYIDKTGGIIQTYLDGTLITNVTAQSFPTGNMDQLDIMAYASGTAGAAGSIYYDEIEAAGSATYWPSQRAAFPSIQGSVATSEQTVATTSHPINMPAGIVAGEMIVVIFSSSDNWNLTITGADWQRVTADYFGGSSMVATKIATGSDTLTITTAGSIFSSAIAFRVQNGKWAHVEKNYFGTVANANLTAAYPDLDYENALFVQALMLDGTAVASAAPTNYDLLATKAPAASTGRSLSVGIHQNRVVNSETTTSGWTHASTTDVGIYSIIIYGVDPTLYNVPIQMMNTFETQQSTLATSHSILMPQNIQAGDVIIVHNSLSTAASVTGGNSNGWHEWFDVQNTIGSSWHWRYATGSDSLTLTSSTGAYRATKVFVVRNTGKPQVLNQTGSTASYTAPSWSAPTQFGKEQARQYRYYQSNIWGATTSPVLGWGGFNYKGTTVNWGTWSNPAAPFIASQYAFEPYVMGTLERIATGGSSYTGSTSARSYLLSSLTFDVAGDSIRTGDLIVVAFAVSSTTGVTAALTAGQGYTTFVDTQIGSTYDSSLVIGYKIVGTTIDTSVGIASTGATANAAALTVFVFRGADPTTPITTPVFRGGRGTTPMNAPSGGYTSSDAYNLSVMARANGTTADSTLRCTDFSYFYIVANGTNAMALTKAYRFGNEPYNYPGVWTGTITDPASAWIGTGFAVNPAIRPTSKTWDFETGSLDKTGIFYWSPSLVSIATGQGQQGTYCGQMNIGTLDGFSYTDNLYERTLYAQLQFKVVITANPTVNETMDFLRFRSAEPNSLVGVRLTVSTTGALALVTYSNQQAAVVGTPTSINAGQWYTLGLKVVVGYNSDGAIETRLDNTIIASATAYGTGSAWRSYINRIQTNAADISGTTTTTGFVYVDNIQYDINNWPPYPQSVSVTGVNGATALGSETVLAKANALPATVVGTTSLGTVTVTTITPVNVSVTGLEGTTALGSETVVAKANTSVTTVLGTTALGSETVTLQQNVAVTGLAGTTALGSETVTLLQAVPVTGLAGTTALGTVTTIAKATASPTTVVGTTAIGTINVLIPVYVTGVSATGAAGTATVIAKGTTPTTGVEATGAAGTATVIAKAVAAATGSQGDTALGTVTFKLGATVAVTGVTATGAAGTADATGKANAPVTTVLGTTTAGTATVYLNTPVAVSGVQATGQTGTLDATGKANVTLTGVQGTTTLGTVVAGVIAVAQVSGVSATGAAGTANATGKASTTTTGVAGTTALGTATASIRITAPVTGLAGTSALGTTTVVAKASTAATGFEATGTAETVTVAAKANTPVTGLAGTSALGTVSVIAIINMTAPVSGVQATTAVGNVTITFSQTIYLTGFLLNGYAGQATVWGNIIPNPVTGWTPIGPTVPSGWTPVAPAPGTAWGAVAPSQNPGYTQINPSSADIWTPVIK